MSIPVSYPYKASSANTSSSKLALPERSPRPLTHVWGTATPASTAARLFATASPKSLWPWNESSVGCRRRFSCPKNQAITGGVITSTVSQTTARCAPAAVHASYKSTTKSRSARNVSSVTNDTFRADLDFVVDLYDACTAAGAHRAVVCDTVGVMTPPGIAWFFGQLKRRLQPTELSFHGHNDFGLAVANSLAAVEEGVQVPRTCVNGLGERSGNASFEELVLALEALYEYDTGIEVARLYELSQLVERLSGIPLGVAKPLVGHNAFAHESGIHAHGVIKHTATYEPIQPERIGRQRTFVFGKHTGSLAVAEKLRSYGAEATPDQVLRLVSLIKDFSEARSKKDQQDFIRSFRERVARQRGVTDGELRSLAEQAAIAVRETPKSRGSG